MKIRFEYMIKSNCQAKDLNDYGIQRWELVSCIMSNGVIYSYFKRQLL